MSYGTAPPLAQEPQDPSRPGQGEYQQALRDFAGGKPDYKQALAEFAAPLSYQKSEEAQSLKEGALLFGASSLKLFADGTTRFAGGFLKAAGGAGTLMIGEGFDAGWNFIAKEIESQVGTTDPDTLDVAYAIGKKVGAFNEGEIKVGQKFDEMVRRRIGNWAVASETLGTVGSFMTGGPAAFGRAAAAGAKPAAALLERTMFKAAAKNVTNREMVDHLLATGQAWNWLARNPQWQQTATMFERGLAMGGRNIDDVMSVTAANIAQSYGIAPDSERSHAAWIAAQTSWLMTPIARIGQAVAGRIAAGGMSPAQAQASKRVYDQLYDGTIGLKEADAAFKELLPGGGRMGGAHLVSSAVEGFAFMGITPEANDLMKQFVGGDTDAGGKLMAMYFGTVGGILTGKYALPQDLAPLFKHVRPDLNKLDLYIEAEANKRVAEQPPQEPVKPDAGKVLDAELDAQGKPIEEKAFRDWESAQEREFARKQLYEKALNQSETDMRARYGWAAPHTAAILRAGFEPSFRNEASSDVWLDHGKDFSVLLQNGADGQPSLQFSDKVAAVLREAGRDPDAHSTLTSPGLRTATGDGAHKVLDDLALIAVGRQQQGDLTYTRLGFREIKPGVWSYDAGDLHYTMQLDGTSATKAPLDHKWIGSEDVVTVSGYGEPKWDHPNVQALSEMLRSKEALSPDPLVDGVIGQAITQARYSDSIGAGQLRALFEGMPPEALTALMKPGSDDYLALLLGSLGAGHSNAPETALKLAEQPPAAGEAAKPAQGEPEAPMAPATEPTLSDRLDPHDMPPEPGSEMVAGSAGAVMREPLAKGAKVAEAGAQEMFGSYADRLQSAAPKDSGKFVLRGRQAETEGQILERAALRAGEPAVKAYKKLGKARREQVLLNPQEPTHGTVPALLEVADARAPGRTQREQQFQQGMQASGQALWNAGVEAGMVRPTRTAIGDVEIRPMEPRSKATLQRTPGKDADVVFGTDSIRKAMFEVWAKENPNVTVPDGHGGRRPITGTDIEAQWKASVSGGKVDIAESEAAIEFMRRFKRVPYTFQGKKVFESNLIKTMESAARKQASRIATAAEFGQGMPEATRAALIKELKASGKSPKALKALTERQGIDKAVETFQREIAGTGSEEAAGHLREMASEWAKMLQGTTPEALRDTGIAGKILRPINAILRPAITAFRVGAFDIPEVFSQGFSHLSVARTLRAFAGVARHPIEAIRYADRVATIDRDMSDHTWDEAGVLLRKFGDAANWTNNALEKFKGAVYTKIADGMIADWKAGKVTINDRQVVRDLLRLPGEMEQALLAGKAGPKVENLFRRAAARFLSAKEGPAGQSRFAANKGLQKWFLFGRWASRRAGNTLKVISSVQRAAEANGWKSKEVGVAAVRLAKVMGGYAVSGAIGQALGYALIDAMNGENGFKRYWDALKDSPKMMLAKSFGQQLLGGPLAQFFGAVRDQRNPQAIAKTLTPLAIAYAVGEAFDDLAKGDYARGLYHFASQSGAIPYPLAPLMQTWTSTQNPTLRGDAKAVHAWERERGIQQPPGQRDKPDQFYDAVDRIINHVDASGGDNQKAWDAALADIRDALAVAPKGSLAGSIDGRRLVATRTLEERQDLTERINDDDRMTRIYQHDAALHTLARRIRKDFEDTPTPIGDSLELAESQARMGASDKWDNIADQAVENASQRLAAGEGFGSEIDDVAMSMAKFPEQLKGVVTDRVLRGLVNPNLDTTARARRIAAILRSRARDRQQAARKEHRER